MKRTPLCSFCNGKISPIPSFRHSQGVPSASRADAVLMQPSALLPQSDGALMLPSQAAVALVAALDSMNRGRIGPAAPTVVAQKTLTLDDYSVCKRFHSNGGGWGYSGGSSDAIAFTVDGEVCVGGGGGGGGGGGDRSENSR